MIEFVGTGTSNNIALERIYRLVINLNGIPYLLAFTSDIYNTSMFRSKAVKVY
jgi:hypothetical protein